MSTQLYTSLVEGFCNITGLDDPAAIMRGIPVETNGIAFSLIHNEKINPNLLFIYCDFGNPPVDGELDGYRLLLKKNLFFYDGHGPVFTISPETGHVILAHSARLDEATPGVLADRLVEISNQVHELREELLAHKNAARQRTSAPKAESASFLFSQSRK